MTTKLAGYAARVYASSTHFAFAAANYRESQTLSHFQRRTRIATTRKALMKAARSHLRVLGVPRPPPRQVLQLLTDMGCEAFEFPELQDVRT